MENLYDRSIASQMWYVFDRKVLQAFIFADKKFIHEKKKKKYKEIRTKMMMQMNKIIKGCL